MAIPMMRAKRMWVAKAHALSRLEVAGQAWPSSIILTKHLFGIDSDKAHKAWFDMSSHSLPSLVQALGEANGMLIEPNPSLAAQGKPASYRQGER